MPRNASRSMGRKSRRLFQFEALEPRAMMSASTNTVLNAPLAPPAGPTMAPMLTATQVGSVIKPVSSVTTTGPFNPLQIRQIYGFNNLSLTGAGTTIAIVDAFFDPTIVQDLRTFDTEFSLPDAPVKIQNFTTTTNAQWDLETALDVEWAHAIAPAANILLVEAKSGSTDDLMSAVDYARNAAGVSVVSMSFGGPEFEQSWNPGSWTDENQTDYDSNTLFTPQGHQPVSFVASAGDVGSRPLYPSTSPNVLAVGGTVITASEATTVASSSVPNNWQSMSYSSETAWSDGGGGFSGVESRPAYQDGFNSNSMRSTPDVAYGATGFWVFDSNNGDWNVVSGTSAGAPQWAGIIALANQERTQLGGTSLSNTVADIYQLPSTDFHDITTGSTGLYQAKVGFDQTTGRGTPIANLLVNDLARSEWLPPPTKPTGSTTGIGITGVGSTGVNAAAPAVTTTTTTTTSPTTSKTTATTATTSATSGTMKPSLANVVVSPPTAPTARAAAATTVHASDAVDQLLEALFDLDRRIV